MKFTSEQVSKLNKHQLSRYHLYIESEKRKERRIIILALILAAITTYWRYYGN